jgi:hypothetical protein
MYDLYHELYSPNINTEMSTSHVEPFVFLKHHEWVFFHLDVFDKNWLFVIPCTPRGKIVFGNVLIAIVAPSPEDDDVNVSGEVNVGDHIELEV